MVTVFTVTLFFSCKNNFKEVQNIGILDGGPLTIAENINTKYTDSGKLKSILISPKMLNYSNREFAFYEFPEGINLTLFDADNNENNVAKAAYEPRRGSVAHRFPPQPDPPPRPFYAHKVP